MGKRLNPVELVIFGVVTLGFVFSAWRLTQERPDFEGGMLAPMASNPLSETERDPAATAPLFAHVSFECESLRETTVSASKIRISGPICGVRKGAEDPEIVTAAVVNSANQFQATVFTDLSAGKFSTDYIPLNSDKNAIRVEFRYKSGKSTTHDLVILKN